MENKKKEVILTQEEAKEIVEGLIKNSEELTKDRKTTFQKYETFVLDGEQWAGEEEPEGDDPKMTFNQSEDFINTYQSKLFPRNAEKNILEIGASVKETDKTKKLQYEKEIFDTYRKNKIERTVIEQSQNYFIGGAGCFYFPQDPITKKAKIISLDPTTVYLGWSGSKLMQFAFEDEISLAEAEKDRKRVWLIDMIKNFLSDEKEASKKFRKVKRFTYWDEDYQIVKVEDDYKIYTNENKLIPFAWIPNQPKTHRHEGTPEAKKLVAMEKEYNKRSSDFALRVKKNTKALLAVMSEGNASDLKPNENGVLPLGKDEDAKYLTLTENKELLDFLGNIEKKMASKMAVNDAVNGEIKSNVSSLSMVYYFSPLMDRIALKRIYWDEAFRELNHAILTYAFGTKDFDTDPIYQPVLLTDAETKIKNIVMLVQNHMMSIEDAIDKTQGMENAGEKLKEIIDELVKYPQLAPTKQNSEIKTQ